MYKTRLFLNIPQFRMLSATIAMAFFVFAAHAQTPVATPTANFEKVWLDYDVTENSTKGMRVHVKFNVRGMKGVDSNVRILFETGDGKKLRDKNKSYYATTGDVALFRSLKIDYDPGYYEDLTLFMPYSELDLDTGEYDLKMDIDLIKRDGTLIKHLTFYDFVFTQPEKKYPEAPMPNSIDDRPTGDAVVRYDKAWVEYGVTENGKKGMRVHVKFTVENLKNVSSDLRLRVSRQGGEFLKSSDFGFSNTDGELSLTKKIKPGYPVTNYEDETLFIPYEQLKFGRGSFNLQLDIDLLKPGKDPVVHLGFYDFVFKNGVN